MIGAAAEAPELGMEVHPLAAAWFAALADGPEAQLYSPALWQRARIVARMLSGVLESSRPSSTMYTALQTDMRSLMVDAAELRRLGITVTADPGSVPDNVMPLVAMASSRRGAGGRAFLTESHSWRGGYGRYDSVDA